MLKGGEDSRKSWFISPTPIIHASQKGRLNAITWYHSGVIGHDKSAEGGFTTLIIATRNGYFDIFELLLEKGANIHDKTKIAKVHWKVLVPLFSRLVDFKMT